MAVAGNKWFGWVANLRRGVVVSPARCRATATAAPSTCAHGTASRGGGTATSAARSTRACHRHCVPTWAETRVVVYQTHWTAGAPRARPQSCRPPKPPQAETRRTTHGAPGATAAGQRTRPRSEPAQGCCDGCPTSTDRRQHDAPPVDHSDYRHHHCSHADPAPCRHTRSARQRVTVSSQTAAAASCRTNRPAPSSHHETRSPARQQTYPHSRYPWQRWRLVAAAAHTGPAVRRT